LENAIKFTDADTLRRTKSINSHRRNFYLD